ncbi:tetratricopeptide repeat protein [Promicromonospora sp. NPDC057488]|uniref:tetratricopeptide repeat protein n=1 Tax=Promicromonospora sp. NPDC057488 TaxID=3346147 RepID=UPI00366F340B
MVGVRMRPWWWLVAGGLVATGAGLFALVEGSTPWLVLGFVAACASPALPFVARWWADRERTRVERRAVVESSVQPVDTNGPSSLLAPDHQVVPFQGRSVELAALVGWCEADGSPLRLITGPGGVGKSRLGEELRALMSQLGWRCVAVGDEQEATILARVRGTTDGPVLLVVDYADTRHEIDHLVRQVAAEPTGVRVLLIARSAGEWWKRLSVGSPRIRAMVQGAYDGLELAYRIDAGASDQEILDTAAAAFAQHVGIPTPPVHLTGPSGGRVLDLHAVSLVTVLRALRHEPLDVEVTDVFAELLGHEQRHWIGTAAHVGLLDGPDGLTTELLGQAVAAIYLTSPADQAEARDVLARVDRRVATPKVLAWLRDLYPPRSNQQWIGTLQPDRMAELHLVNELSASTPLAAVLLDRLAEREARNAIAVLARAVADHFSDHDVRTRALALLDRAIGGLPDDAELLRSVSAVIPYPSEVLTRPNLDLLERILALTAPSDSARRSWVLHEIAQRRFRLGRASEALGPLREAISLRQALAAAEPGENTPLLGASLRYLGVILSELGEPHHALSATQQGVQIELRLPRTDRLNRLPQRARILCDLGARYHEAGLPDQAIGPLRQSVEINERLAHSEPEQTNPHLARALMNLAIAQNMLGHAEQALPSIRKAVAIRQVLARDNPDSDLVFLARALTDLSSCLVNATRPQEAIEPNLQAVQILREVAQASPGNHNPGLARSLRQLATAYRDAGHTSHAAACYHEAIAIHRDLATTRPGRRTWMALAESLAGLVSLQLTVQHPLDSLPLAREASQLLAWRTQVTRPEHLRPFAQALTTVLIAVANALDANDLTKEAQEFRREIAALRPAP